MPAAGRPSVQIITISTSTGTFPDANGVDFGEAFRYSGYADNRTAANKDIAGTVQASLGNSGKWMDVITLTTNSSGTFFASASETTGSTLTMFDKLRVVVTTNNSTESFPAWLAANH